MYDIFIKNYLNGDGSAIITDETPVYSIPILESMENRVFIDPNVKTEMGKAGSMDFSLRSNNIYYDKLQQMRTIIRVEFNGTSLFRGRVLTIDNAYFSGSRSVHLEGDMAFLMDSQQAGVKEENREKITILQHLSHVISAHNEQMRQNDEPDKAFELGEVPGKYSSAVTAAQRITVADKKFGSDSWRRTMDELESLKKEYGGYFRTRFVSASQASDHREHHYIDWLQAYFNPNVNLSQPIQVTSNMIDINSTTEVNNLFTVLIPIGDNNGEPLYVQEYTPSGGNKRTTKYISVPELLNFCTESQLTRGYHIKSEYRDAIKQYGTIYKVQTFSNAKTQDVLWSYAIEWMLNNYVGGINSFTVRAIDLHHIDSNKQKYLTGDRVKVIYPDNGGTEEKTLTVLSVQYKLHNPDQNSYSVGIPSDLLSKEYGNSSNKKKSSDKKAYTPNYNGDGPSDTDVYTTVDEYKQMAYNYIVSKRYNGDIYDQLMQEDPVKAERALTSTVITVTEGLLASDARPTSGTHKKRLNTMLLDGITGSLSINGPIDHSHDFTDEEVDAINKNNRFMTIDAMKQEFGINAVMDYFTPESLKKPTPTLLDLKIQSNQYGMIDIYGADKKTNANAPQTASINGALGSLNAMTTKLGANGSGVDSVVSILQNGLLGSTTHYDRNGGTTGNIKKIANEILPEGMKFWNTKTDTTSAESASIKSTIGAVNSIFSFVGKDGTGTRATITNDGTTSKTSYVNPNNAGSTSDSAKTIEMDGNGTSGEGKINVGGKGNGDWRVQLNNKVTYTDEHGDTYTLPGFVTAEDFSMLQSIPSFKTKYAVVDTLVAGKVTASTIQADLAYIRDLSSDTIKANRSVRAGAGYFTNGYTTNMHASNYFVAGEDGWSSGGNLLSCVNGADPISVDSNGKVTITLKRIGSGSDIVLTFNQAATTFYKNAVAASYDSDHSMFIAGAGSYDQIKTATLNPGESHNYWPTFAKQSGGYQSGELIKVTARSLNLQAKSVAPSTTAQTITADSGRDGLSSVNVSAATKQAKTVSASTSSNVEVTADAGYYGLSKVTVNQFKVQSKTVTPGKDAKVILPDSGYSALSNVSLNGDDDLVAGNIKSGVSIFGVTGTYSGSSASVTDISIWEGSTEHTSDFTISSPVNLRAWCKVNGSWYDGAGNAYAGPIIRVTPSGGSSYTSLGSWYYTKYQLPSGLWHHQFVLEQSGSSISGLSNNTSYKIYK